MAYYPPGGGYPAGGGYPPGGSYPPAGGYPYPAGGGYPSPPVYYPPVRRGFYIISEMHGKVMDIRGGFAGPGAQVIMYNRKPDRSPNQLWYLDEMGCIRSMLNDYAPECRGQGDKVHMEPCRGDPRQQWVFQGNRIINRVFPAECLDIEGEDRRDEISVIAWPYKASINQHWRIEYI